MRKKLMWEEGEWEEPTGVIHRTWVSRPGKRERRKDVPTCGTHYVRMSGISTRREDFAGRLNKRGEEEGFLGTENVTQMFVVMKTHNTAKRKYNTSTLRAKGSVFCRGLVTLDRR